jgi:ubiquinone/menaquinone biosynthesis C-methylase UbiE
LRAVIAVSTRRAQARALEWMHDIHFDHVHQWRVRGLTRSLGAKLPEVPASILDVGSGDGLLASEIRKQRRHLQFTGVDIIPRRESFIPVQIFDGSSLPFADDSFDTVMFVDVLHHTSNPHRLLVEAARVARRDVVIKDHICESVLDRWTLRGMDYMGNRHNGVPLPYDYWAASKWRRELRAAGLRVTGFDNRIRVYPAPLNAVIGRGLHVVISARPAA